MIRVRLHGTSEEIKKFADFLYGAAGVRVLQRSEPYADRGKSVYERVYMDVELLPPTPAEITLNDNGDCPCKGIIDGEEICAISLQNTNGAVMCDFEYENCPLFQQSERYKKRTTEEPV